MRTWMGVHARLYRFQRTSLPQGDSSTDQLPRHSFSLTRLRIRTTVRIVRF